MDKPTALSITGVTKQAGLAMFALVWQSEEMKKQAADQSFHDRRYQERKRAEAARKPVTKKADEAKVGGEKSGTGSGKRAGEGNGVNL